MASSVFLLAKRIPWGPTLLVASFAQLYFVRDLLCCRLALMRLPASQGRNYLAVGCTTGIYVGIRADACESMHFRLSQSLTRLRAAFRKVLDFIKPTSIIALPESNSVLVHWETSLFSYPLDLFIRVSQGGAAIQELNHSAERLAHKDGSVLFCKAGRVANRTLGEYVNITPADISYLLQTVAYATKSFVNVTLSILEAIPWNGKRDASPYRSFGSVSLRSFSERFMFTKQTSQPVPVPRDTHDVSFLQQFMAICSSKSIHILRPMKWVFPLFLPSCIDCV
jgi:hypothetical protein